MPAFTIDDYLKQQAAPEKKAYNVGEYINQQSGVKAPIVKPGATALLASSNYTSAMQQQGYQPQAEQAGAAFNTVQQEAINNNMAINRDDYSRAQGVAADKLKAENTKNIEGGYDANAKVPLPKEMQERLAGAHYAFDSMNDLQAAYQNGLKKSPGFGTPFVGGIPTEKWDPVRQAFEQQSQLSSPGVLNGILGYTSGADSKESMKPKLEALLPNAASTPQMADQNFINLKRTALEKMQADRATVQGRPGMDTYALDNEIQQRSREVSQDQQIYDLKYTNPQNPGGTLSPQSSARLDQLSGKPQPDPISSFSPTRPQQPQTAQQMQQPAPQLQQQEAPVVPSL